MGVVVKELLYDDGIVCFIRELWPITFLCKVPEVLAALLLHDIVALWYDRLVITLLMAWHRCCNSETDRNESIINLIRRY